MGSVGSSFGFNEEKNSDLAHFLVFRHSSMKLLYSLMSTNTAGVTF